MASPPSLPPLVGSWTGRSELYLPGMGEELYESQSTLTVEAPQEGYVIVRYDWQMDGVRESGEVITAINKAGQVTAAWVDSWHQSGEPMRMVGTDFSVTGAYSAPDGPDWGWRLEIRAEGENLALEMTNISPEGEETWAVRANYSRAQNISPAGS